MQVYTYLTGKESRELQSIFFKKARFDGTKLDGFEATAIIEAEEFVLKTMVVAFNGNKEGAFDAVQNLPQSDYASVVGALNESTKAAVNPDFLGGSSTSTP